MTIDENLRAGEAVDLIAGDKVIYNPRLDFRDATYEAGSARRVFGVPIAGKVYTIKEIHEIGKYETPDGFDVLLTVVEAIPITMRCGWFRWLDS